MDAHLVSKHSPLIRGERPPLKEIVGNKEPPRPEELIAVLEENTAICDVKDLMLLLCNVHE
jgi:hypothetical protein